MPRRQWWDARQDRSQGLCASCQAVGGQLQEDISDSGRLLQGVAKGILEIELLSLERKDLWVQGGSEELANLPITTAVI